MQVAILCGGRGTRIRGSGENVPKPMIKIGSYPKHEASDDHQVWITVEAATTDEVNLAVDRLLELLPADEILRVDRG